MSTNSGNVKKQVPRLLPLAIRTEKVLNLLKINKPDLKHCVYAKEISKGVLCNLKTVFSLLCACLVDCHDTGVGEVVNKIVYF